MPKFLADLKSQVITGFNTDVKFQGVTYHVQTEDKGLATPLILSLVYNRGTILASKRSPYNDLVEKGFDEKVLAERLQKQHKTICAAIRAGRIEQLKEMMAKDSAARRKNSPVEKKSVGNQKTVPSIDNQMQVKPEQKPNGESIPKIEHKILPPVQTKQIPAEKPPAKTLSNGTGRVLIYKGNDSPIPKPTYDFSIKSILTGFKTVSPIPKPESFDSAPMIATEEEEELIMEAVEVIEEEMILPSEAVEIVTQPVENKLADNKLKIQILGDDSFKSGEKKTMSILVHRGGRENGLSGAQVMVKVLGAAFRPQIFHGKTDADGIAKVHLQMPLFKQGRAAILIKAMSEGEEIELRRTIRHK